MGVDRPVIGVSCYVEDVDRAPWVAQRSAVLPHGYVVVLPPRPDADDDLAAAVLARLDGLVIAGGADVEAARYGAPPHITSQDPRPDRDAWELALARVSKVARMPVLGICRGMQVMAVAGGAALEQHLPDVVGNDEHCPAPGVYAHHLVTPVSGTRLAGILGDGPLDVPTYHHQAVRPSSLEGTGYRAAAWHDDGTLEAMEDPASLFRVAVQWHPEAGADPRLFDELVASARQGGDRG